MHKLNFKGFRKVAALALSAILLAGSMPNKAIQVDAAGVTDKTANEVVADMTAGWNLGNTLDAL